MVNFNDQQSLNRAYGNSQIMLYEDQPLSITVHNRDDNGQILLAPVVASFNQLKLQTATEADSTLTQILLTDQPTLYTFSRDHRVYTYAAILEDTLLSDSQAKAQSRTGQGATDWQLFYKNFARIHDCSRNNRLVRLVYDGTIVYGAIVESIISQTAQQPHIYNVNFSFYVIADLVL